MKNLSDWNEIWVIDFEYQSVDGELPQPHCMVGREVFSQRLIHLDAEALRATGSPPFSTGQNIIGDRLLSSGGIFLLPSTGLETSGALP